MPFKKIDDKCFKCNTQSIEYKKWIMSDENNTFVYNTCQFCEMRCYKCNRDIIYRKCGFLYYHNIKNENILICQPCGFQRPI